MQPQQQFVHNNGGYSNAQPIPFGNPECQPMEFFHELDSKFKSQIQSLIPSHEQIFYSGTIDKINKRLVFQKRILVITNKYLYNIRPEGEGLFASILPPLSGASIQRKIDVSSIFAASLSVRSQGNKNQFVLHVAGQYDYRYNGGENTEKIIKTIANIYNKAHNAPFIMYFIEETDLGRFHTTDDDLNLGVNKRPRDGKVLVTTEIMQKGLSWIIANRFAILQAQEAQKPQLKQADTLAKVKQQLYTSVPLGGGVVQVKPIISVVPTIKIEQRPVTTIVYNPPVNVVTVGTTKVINLTNGIQTTTTTTMPYQQVVQTTNSVPYQQVVQTATNMPYQQQAQPTYQNQNMYNQPSFSGNMQNQYGSSPMMNQPNYNNQYGANNFNNNNTGSNNAQNNLSDLISVSQQNVTINSNFENKNKPF